MEELFNDTNLDLRIRFIQESQIVTESGDKECLTDCMEWIVNEMKVFITENQDKIKKAYKAIKDGCDTVIPDIPELNFVMREYEDYIDSMKGYLKNCMDSNAIVDTDIRLEEMQEKDKVFFDNTIRVCAMSVKDAMGSVEMIMDLKRFTATALAIFTELQALDKCDKVLRCNLKNFYCRSAITFCMKMLESIKETFDKVWLAVDGYTKPQPTIPYKMF